ncbi:zinc ribbon domain-containing protein [Streptomyces sp. NPDC001634]|uniref:zinc ribbon domain-containing protein n=1 Tax=Streptomyces sp. NPDC001634 TaxID=3154390 RepID=UPI00332D215F
MTSYCPHCGAQVPEEARYCMRCGRERVQGHRGAGEQAVPVAPEQPGAPPRPSGAPPRPTAVPPGPATVPPGPSAAPTAPATPAPATPAAPPAAPPLGPPPPPYAPASAPPSPLGAFFGRALRGDWGGAARAAAWPVGLVLLAALALAIPSYGQRDVVVVGFGDRLQIALAVLLQALGGGLEVKDASGSLLGDASGGLLSGIEGGGSLSLIPLTATALWIGALCIGVRILRTRPHSRLRSSGGTPSPRGPRGATAGLEAAVRVALLVAAATLVLGLCARPTLADAVEISTSPWLAALGALLLGLAVAGGVLHRDDLTQWLAVRPGARTVLRATGTALRAFAVVLVLCCVVAFVVCVTQFDDSSGSSAGSSVLFALLLLPNLAVLALGLSWGASVDVEASGSSPYGGGYRHQGFGLSELGDQVSGWAVVGALALGLVCALTLGVIAARRSADRREQLLSAGIFVALFLLLAWIGSFGWQLSAGSSSGYDSGYGYGYGFGSGSGSAGTFGGTVEAGVSLPEGLLFGALWVFGAVFVAPHLARMTGGRRTTVVGPPIPPIPPTPSAPAGYGTGTPPAHGDATAVPPALVQPPPAPAELPAPTASYHQIQAVGSGAPAPGVPVPKRRSRVLVWVVTVVGACVIGGGAAAGLLFWQGHH